MRDKDRPLSGIRCTAVKCRYNTGDYRCTADAIQVKHKDSRNSEDTECATFIPMV
jgi:hypothetical protein